MRYGIVVLTILLLLPQTLFAQEAVRSITVSGSSTITAEAEFALIHAQLKVVSASVEESYQSVTRLLSELAEKLQPLGVTKEDLTSSMVVQGTEYDYNTNPRTVSGYYSACSLRIRVKAIADTYRIHRELARYQTLSIDQTEYGRNDEALLHTTALQKALQAAEAKARAMTTTMGAKLGPVLDIREGNAAPVPMRDMKGVFSAQEAADPGEVTTTGSITVSGAVMVSFEIR